jgi:hypothetical protein
VSLHSSSRVPETTPADCTHPSKFQSISCRNQTGVPYTITKLDGSASPSKKWAADDPIEALPGERTPNGTGLAGQHWESSSPVERLHGLSSFKPQCGIPTVKGVLCNWQVLANQHDGADEADSTLVLKDYQKRPPIILLS